MQLLCWVFWFACGERLALICKTDDDGDDDEGSDCDDNNIVL